MSLKPAQKKRLQRIVAADSETFSGNVDDKRLHPRQPVRLMATVVVQDGKTGEPEGVSLCAQILNLSASGAMIATSTPLEIGSLFLRILTAEAGPNVIESRVVHSSFRKQRHPFVYGVEFRRSLSEDEFAEILQVNSSDQSDIN